MPKNVKDIANLVIQKMAESDRALGLDKRAYNFVDLPTQETLQDYNKKKLEEAGTKAGIGGGVLGGGALGAGLGAILAKGAKGSRAKLKGAGKGGLLLGVGGAVAGGLIGPRWGASQAPRVTERDIAALDDLAQRQEEEGGLGLTPGYHRLHGEINELPGDDELELYPYETLE